MAEGLEGLGGGRHLIGGIGDVTVESAEIPLELLVILGDGAKQHEDLFGLTLNFFTLEGKEDGLEMGVESRRGDGIDP